MPLGESGCRNIPNEVCGRRDVGIKGRKDCSACVLNVMAEACCVGGANQPGYA